MHESPSTTPAEAQPEPYAGCPHCAPYRTYENSLEKLRLRQSRALPNVKSGDIDWSDYYWGYERYKRRERRTIVRPLSLSITDRIPLELFEHTLDFLRWEPKDLYNCALVCRAWHHHAQHLLNSRVIIQGHAPTSKQYLAKINVLRIGYDRGPLDDNPRAINGFHHARKMHFSTIPLALGTSMHSLQCLEYFDSISPPYHPSFIRFFSCFSSVTHLSLTHFRLYSFAELRHIICGLTNLRELDLYNGTLISRTEATNPPPVFPPVKAPRISRLHLDRLERTLFSKLAQWISSTEVCCGCTDTLYLTIPLNEGPACDELLRKLGPSLDYLTCQSWYPESWQHLGGLTSCTRLSIMRLDVQVDPTDSWQGLATALGTILSQCSSPVLSGLHITIEMRQRDDSRPAASHWHDSEFETVELGFIHDLMKTPLFDSLQCTSICVFSPFDTTSLACNVVLTKEEMERRICLILEPWDKRGILSVKGYHERTT